MIGLAPQKPGMNEAEVSLFGKNAVNDRAWWNLWTKNVDFNLPRVEKWASDLFSEKRDGPVIVCGAGPSLTENLKDVMKACVGGVPVIAVDRAHKVLKAVGITPLVTVSVDAQDAVVGFLDSVDGRDRLAANLTCSPKFHRLSEMTDAPIHWFGVINQYSPFARLMCQRYGWHIAQVRAGICVTFSAIDIAFKMGFDVYTTGNELSFPDLESCEAYCAGTVHEPIERDDGRYTIGSFERAADSIDCFPLMHPEHKWIDCSGGILENWERGTLPVGV